MGWIGNYVLWLSCYIYIYIYIYTYTFFFPISAFLSAFSHPRPPSAVIRSAFFKHPAVSSFAAYVWRLTSTLDRQSCKKRLVSEKFIVFNLVIFAASCPLFFAVSRFCGHTCPYMVHSIHCERTLYRWLCCLGGWVGHIKSFLIQLGSALCTPAPFAPCHFNPCVLSDCEPGEECVRCFGCEIATCRPITRWKKY